MAKKYLTFAAERGFTPAYYDLVVWYRNNGDSDTANQWFARALEAGEPPALLEEGMMLLKLQPLAPEELQARLNQLYNLALNHCWNALELLCIICKLRMANETVKAFAPRPLRLLQGLARQGFAPAMLALGDYYNTIMLAPDAAHRDNKVHYWYDMAAEHGLDEGLIRSIRAGFFGPVYNRGPVHAAIARVKALHSSDEATNAELKGLLGSLLRPINVPGEDAEQSDKLLLEAAHAGKPEDLCRTIRAEIIWDDDSVDNGYPDKTLLDDTSLDKIPSVLFTRGQTLINYPGERKEVFRKDALQSILDAMAEKHAVAISWMTDALLRGLYGLPQQIEDGLYFLQTGLKKQLPRYIALDVLRQLGWIRGIPGEDHVDRAWMKELLGMAASADDCLGYAGLVLLEALEPASPKRQQEIAADLQKAILWARTHADASALYLLGCVAGLHLDDPNLNAVCKYHDALVTRLTGEPGCRDEYAAHLATSVFHSASLLGEPRAELLVNLVQPELGNLARLREEGKSLEEFM